MGYFRCSIKSLSTVAFAAATAAKAISAFDFKCNSTRKDNKWQDYWNFCAQEGPAPKLKILNCVHYIIQYAQLVDRHSDGEQKPNCCGANRVAIFHKVYHPSIPLGEWVCSFLGQCFLRVWRHKQYCNELTFINWNLLPPDRYNFDSLLYNSKQYSEIKSSDQNLFPDFHDHLIHFQQSCTTEHIWNGTCRLKLCMEFGERNQG